MFNYNVTHFTWRDGNPGLFMRAELTFASSHTLPVYVSSRAGQPERMPGGGHSSEHARNGGRFRIHTMRTWEKTLAQLTVWIHNPDNANTLIDTLLADVENQRANAEVK